MKNVNDINSLSGSDTIVNDPATCKNIITANRYMGTLSGSDIIQQVGIANTQPITVPPVRVAGNSLQGPDVIANSNDAGIFTRTLLRTTGGSVPCNTYVDPDYEFSGVISEEMLHRYLDRSLQVTQLSNTGNYSWSSGPSYPSDYDPVTNYEVLYDPTYDHGKLLQMIIEVKAKLCMFGSNSGDGGPATIAKLGNPTGVKVDNNGNVYIAGVKIRKVNSSGIINTIVGNGTGGSLGDGGPATSAHLTAYNLALDAHGNIYIADFDDSRIRLVSYGLGILYLNIVADDVNIWPNPTNGTLNIISSAKITAIIISNVLGQTVYSHNYTTTQVQVNVLALPQGIYFIKINGTVVKRFVKD